jgi:tungstate transport system substrate-binding protein
VERGAPRELVLASTTSTEDSGLFDVLLPAFEREHPQFQIKLIAVGSGQALALGRRGDADVLLVHSPADEEAFMREGHGTTRVPVMMNDFVLLGPETDPAAVRAATEAADAMRRVASAGAPFVSRGDSSGTHRKELALWRAAGVDPRGAPWYMEVGQGMGDALRVASERGGYVLSDRGTYLFLAPGLDLSIAFEGDEALFNPYSVIVVSRARNARGAEAFSRWITAQDAQVLIGSYGVERFGAPLFTPAMAGSEAR